MGLVELFLLAVGLSMDAFAVSVCKGLSTQKLKWKHYLTIGLWFGGFQALMPTIGYFLGSTFEAYITSVDHWVAFVLLSLIGGNMLREGLSKETSEERHEPTTIHQSLIDRHSSSGRKRLFGRAAIIRLSGNRTKQDRGCKNENIGTDRQPTEKRELQYPRRTFHQRGQRGRTRSNPL